MLTPSARLSVVRPAREEGDPVMSPINVPKKVPACTRSPPNVQPDEVFPVSPTPDSAYTKVLFEELPLSTSIPAVTVDNGVPVSYTHLTLPTKRIV